MNKVSFPHQCEDVSNEKYPHVVCEEHCKAYDDQSETTSIEDDGFDKLEG